MRPARGRPRQLWPQSLGVRLILASVGVLLLLLTIGILIYRRSVDERRAAELANTVALGQTVAAVAEGFARDLERVTLAAALAMGTAVGPLEQDTEGLYLRALLAEYPHLRALFLTDPDGRVVASDSGVGLGVDVSARPYIAALQQGADRVWSGSLSGLQSGEATVAFGRRVRGPDGATRGFLIAAFYAARMAEGLPLTLPAGAEVAVIDSAGQVLYHTPRADPAASPREDDARDVRAAPGVAAALAGAVVPIQDLATPLPGQARYGVLVPVAGPRWVVALTRPQAPLEADLRDRFLLGAGAVAAAFVAAAGLQVLLVSRLTRPLAVLAGAASAVARGERPPPGALPEAAAAGAEVGQLATAMAAMDEAVAERESRLREEAQTLETLNRTGQVVGAELDLQRVVQAVTDAATSLSGAQLGAFFYNDAGAPDEPYSLYALAGVAREAFAAFPMPRNTRIFEPTFRGSGVLRLDDVLRDPRYGHNPPHHGMPDGHPPVRSYLAVPVISRAGHVIGGLVFGHADPGVFTARAERLVVGLAAQAAVAVDNARLFEEAQQAVRLREEFMAVAAHELKTPLTSLLGTAQLEQRRRRRLAATGTSGPETHDPATLDVIVVQARRLTRLVGELLDVARMKQGRLPLSPEPTDLTELARQVVASMTAQNGARQEPAIRFTAPAPVPVVVDPLRLEQVLTNLLDNAIKFSPDGGAVEIDVSATPSGGARLTVRDHGLGISPVDRERVFERFQRAHAGEPGQAGAVTAGLGLGLYVARQIVAQHGGTIRVEAPQDGGSGTCLVVLLPPRPVQDYRSDRAATDGALVPQVGAGVDGR